MEETNREPGQGFLGKPREGRGKPDRGNSLPKGTGAETAEMIPEGTREGWGDGPKARIVRGLGCPTDMLTCSWELRKSLEGARWRLVGPRGLLGGGW